MAVSTAVNAKVNRSWADIVKGDVATPAPSNTLDEVASEGKAASRSLQPAARGKYQCYCFGEVLVMLGHYGWIKPFDDIEHPDVAKTGGRIYVHKRDVKSDVKLVRGDVVSFYLYSDDQGLGAECCQVQERHASEFRADADEFVSKGDSVFPSGWNPFATEFTPGSIDSTTFFNPDAPEFDPSAFVNGNCFVSDFAPMTTQVKMNSNLNTLAINPAFLSDDESDEESSFNDADISDNDCCFDEIEQSSEHDSEVHSDDNFVIVHVPFNEKESISDGSTSVGFSSDSDTELAITHSRPPPGLDLPAGFRPPPGLSL